MKTIRMRLSFLVFCLVVTGFVPAAAGQTANVEEHTLTTGDGWPIRITYYESTGGKESPVIILVPGAEGAENSRTRKVWDNIARTLHKNKYAVVTADLRKHGDSIPPTDEESKAQLTRLVPTDYTLMVKQDMQTIKEFLLQEHQKEKLNIRKLGIAAAGSSCLVVAAFAADDWARKPWPDAASLAARTPRGQDVQAILMLSPKATVRGINVAGTMRFIADPVKGIAFQIYFNPSDREEKSAAEKVFRYVDIKNFDAGDARALVEGPTDKAYTAEGLLQGKAAEVMDKKITEFFDTYVRDRDSPWKTRTSRLE